MAPWTMLRRLLQQAAWRAFSLALANTGKRMAASKAMIAITTSNSMSVKPRCTMALRSLGQGASGNTDRAVVP